MDAFDDMMDTPTFQLIGIVFFTSQVMIIQTLQAISTIAKNNVSWWRVIFLFKHLCIAFLCAASWILRRPTTIGSSTAWRWHLSGPADIITCINKQFCSYGFIHWSFWFRDGQSHFFRISLTIKYLTIFFLHVVNCHYWFRVKYAGKECLLFYQDKMQIKLINTMFSNF